MWLSLLLLLVLVQTETGVTAFTFGGGEATAGTGALCDLLLFGPFRLFAVEQLELLKHRLLLSAADRMIRRRRCCGLAIWRRMQIVVCEIRGLLQHGLLLRSAATEVVGD